MLPVRRVLALGLTVLAFAAAARLPASELPAIEALQFFASLLVLGLADVWMPREGEVSDTASPIVFAAVVVSRAPLAVGLLAIVARVLAHASRFGLKRFDSVFVHACRYAVSILMSSLMLVVLLQIKPGMAVPLQLLGCTVAFFGSDYLLANFEESHAGALAFRSTVLKNAEQQGALALAMTCVGILTVLVYPGMRAWALALMVFLLLVMLQSSSLLTDVRMTYDASIGALARAIEVQHVETNGVAGEVSDRVAEVGRRLGLYGTRLERLTYASLFFCLEMVASAHKDEGLFALDSFELARSAVFLAPAAAVLSVCEGASPEQRSSADAFDAYVICATAATVLTANGEGAASLLAAEKAGAIARWLTPNAFRRAENGLSSSGQPGRPTRLAG